MSNNKQSLKELLYRIIGDKEVVDDSDSISDDETDTGKSSGGSDSMKIKLKPSNSPKSSKKPRNNNTKT